MAFYSFTIAIPCFIVTPIIRFESADYHIAGTWCLQPPCLKLWSIIHSRLTRGISCWSSTNPQLIIGKNRRPSHIRQNTPRAGSQCCGLAALKAPSWASWSNAIIVRNSVDRAVSRSPEIA